MSETAGFRLGPAAITAVLETQPAGTATFDAAWTICSVDPAGAAALGRRTGELIGRNLWVALPEAAGSILHSFLLRARGVGTPVTWQGFYPPANRWLTATARVVDELLHVSFREDEQLIGHRTGAGGPEAIDGVIRGGNGDRLRYLAEVSESLITTLDTGESAIRLAELVVPRLADWALLTLLDDDGASGQESWAHGDPAGRADLDVYLRGRLRGTTANAALLEALRSGAPVQVTTIDPAVAEPSLITERVRAAWRRLDVTSCTIVPLRARGETFGAIALMNCGDRPPHTEMEIATAVEVARRGGLALDNARLYGRQLKVAETLQLSLLTAPPQLEHLQIAVRYRPAGLYQQVGGDWYDAFSQPDGASLLVIGDVAGHSVEATAAMSQIRSILRGIASDRPRPPAELLARVDAVLTSLHVDTLATVLAAQLEPALQQPETGQRTLRWSSAGHLPPLLVRADGTVELLATPPERLLGTDQPARRTDHAITLCPGDTVLLYTDGLVEHRGDLDEGTARLVAALAELGRAPLDELCDELLTRLAGDPTDDDIALLALRCDREDGLRAAEGGGRAGPVPGRSLDAGELARCEGRAVPPATVSAGRSPGLDDGRSVAAPAQRNYPLSSAMAT